MANIKKIKEGTLTIYPATIPQAVVDPTSGKTVRTELDEKATSAELDQLAGEVSLLDAVQGAKIKDIENVLSTANLNQSAQLSVSGVSPLSLPKNASNGGMQMKLEGLTAENLVVNGDFRSNDTSQWSPYRSLLTLTPTALQVTKNSAVFPNELTAQVQSPISAIAGKKYYIRLRVRVLDAICQTIAINRPDANFSVITNPVSGQWYEVKAVRTATHTGGLSITSVYATAADANGKILEIDRAYGVMCIDLTALFGAGNEPTKEQCDLMFSDYFEGKKNFEPTGRIRSVDKNGLNPTALYLTAPELRSNGTVKDEIRKGANGYELVKRVGVGTLGANGIAGGDFEGGLAGSKVSADEISSWAINNVTPISGTQDGRLSVTTVGTNLQRPMLTFPLTRLSGQYRRLSLSYKVNSGTPALASIHIGGGVVYPNKTFAGSGNYEYYYLSNGTGALTLYFNGMYLFDIQIDNLKDELINVVDGTSSGGSATQFSDGTILYTLATPEIIPISYGGILNSAENGTVYHEQVIADAGVYGTNLPILLPDYPIASIEEIIKYEDGVDTYLNVATAVIASDGLSFTHPNLASGNLVLLTYAFDKESTNGNITATFYDSNVVKIDTVTGKAYRINEVITNGVLTRTLTEV